MCFLVSSLLPSVSSTIFDGPFLHCSAILSSLNRLFPEIPTFCQTPYLLCSRILLLALFPDFFCFQSSYIFQLWRREDTLLLLLQCLSGQAIFLLSYPELHS